MIWFLVVTGILLIVLGAWGGPRRRQRLDKASRIPNEATVQEAWEILTTPVEYDEELIKIPEDKPGLLPGVDRRFQQGLLVGLGLGLMVAALVVAFLPRGQEPRQQVASNPPAVSNPPVAKAEQPAPKPESSAAPAQTQAAPQPSRPATVTFVVEEGSPSQKIAADLKAAGLIKSEQEFLDLVFALGMETQLKAGTFEIPSDASVDAVIKLLTQ